MRFDKHFSARTAFIAGLVASALSVFGSGPVHAQTTPAMPASVLGPIRQMSIDDAVATALEQNLDLQVQRINPQLQDLSIAGFRAAYTPNFVSTLSTADQTQPVRSFFDTGGGLAAAPISSGQSLFNFGVASLSNWFGGSYDVRWNNTRLTSTNPSQSFNPELNT